MPALRRWSRRLALAASLLVGIVLICGLLLKSWTRLSVADTAPLIGTSLDSSWHARLGISTTNYEVALARVGARLETVRVGDLDPGTFLDRIDGLLLTGGGDIDPDLYGGKPGSALLVDRTRDDFELSLINEALERGMPILGICRGIQLLNVARGGTLINLRDKLKLARRHDVGSSSMSAHLVTIAAGSRLGEMLGDGPQQVNSFHGQAVGRLGHGLRVVARASDDTVEAIEVPGDSFVVATQWHPEIPPQQIAVFAQFLQAARRYRRARGQHSGQSAPPPGAGGLSP